MSSKYLINSYVVILGGGSVLVAVEVCNHCCQCVTASLVNALWSNLRQYASFTKFCAPSTYVPLYVIVLISLPTWKEQFGAQGEMVTLSNTGSKCI